MILFLLKFKTNENFLSNSNPYLFFLKKNIHMNLLHNKDYTIYMSIHACNYIKNMDTLTRFEASCNFKIKRLSTSKENKKVKQLMSICVV